MKKILLSILMLGVLLASFGVVSAEVNAVTPSTNDQNRDNEWAHVDATPGVGEVTFDFISTRTFNSCFEYRTDGDTSQAYDGYDNYNTDVIDGLYPFVCVNNEEEILTINADEYVEVRMVFGAESDERFDWTRFDVLQPCEVNVLSPEEGESYDPLWINWTYEGDCNPSTYTLQYGPECEGNIWDTINSSLPSKQVPMSYWWDPIQDNVESGEYCIRVRMDQGTGIHVSGYSGIWNLDLAPPVVNLSTGTPQEGECLEEQTGDCFVNNQTEITLTCSDDNPDEDWQSGVKSISYQITGPEGIGDVMTTEENEVTFSFQEDSNHQLEYWCNDNVDKESEHKFKEFIVDSVAPNITRTVTEPQVLPECNGEECIEYFNTETEICVSAEDPEPHPVGLGSLGCAVYWNDSQTQDSWELTLDEDGCFSYENDSWHTLECYAKDNLGNKRNITWFDVVDDQAPETNLSFEGPYYQNELGQWIDGVSRVNLTAWDVQPHPVGHVETYYRYGTLPNSYCYEEESDYAEGDVDWETEGWVEYATPFGIPESCHVIEYYSEDGLGNSEDVQYDFVFSDHTAPEVSYDVEEPAYNCNSSFVNCEDNWDWKVTMNTSVTLSCEDVGSHPSGMDELWYRVIWDGDVESSSWINSSQSEISFKFDEPSEHVVEYYCVDNVNKTSPTENVTFKVDGHAFDMQFENKWNLVSIPFKLLVEDIDAIFGDKSEEIEGIWTYDESGWHVYAPEGPKDFNQMNPGRGYWVKTTEPTSITIGGGDIPATSKPEITVYSGWNLVGHYGLANKEASCAFNSIPVGALEGFNAATQKSYDLLSPSSSMNPGEGYWLGVDGAVGDSYVYYPRNCPST